MYLLVSINNNMDTGKRLNSENILNLKRLCFGEHISLPSPPGDDEEKTSMELELLESVGRNLKDEDKQTIEKYKNCIDVYYGILDQFSLSYDKLEMEELLEDINKIVLFEKYKHKRTPPINIAKKQKFNISEEFIFEKYPSYPSMCATESMFFSLYFSDKFPIYKELFMETSKGASNSRLMSANNYPTDILAGQTLSHLLYNKYKDSIDAR